MESGRPRLRAPTDVDTLPASVALGLAELVARWGVTREALLTGSQIAVGDLDKASERVPLAAINALMSRARELTGEPGIGFHLGLQKRISMYGFLGFAIMTSANLRECVELAVRFTPSLSAWVVLHLDVEDELASLTMEQQIDLGDVNDVVMLSLVVGLGQIASTLTGKAIDAVAEFEMPEPSYYARFAHVMPNARFGRPATRVLFPRSALDLPVATSDRAAMLLARAECERALAALIDDTRISGRVRRVFAARGRLLSLHEAAEELRTSPRTLTRRLAAEGLTFSQLVERERRQQALLLLQRRSLSLEEVTEELNYSTVPNFIRAFKRWTGTTPAFYRRGAARPSDA
jgi:AraC-like DNA-binding protein